MITASKDFQNEFEKNPRIKEFLLNNNFSHYKTEVSHNGLYTRVIFSSSKYKIGVYKNIPEGEVNCKLGLLNVDDSDFDKKDGGWFYLFPLISGQDRKSVVETYIEGSINFNKVIYLLINNFDEIVEKLGS